LFGQGAPGDSPSSGFVRDGNVVDFFRCFLLGGIVLEAQPLLCLLELLCGFALLAWPLDVRAATSNGWCLYAKAAALGTMVGNNFMG
jgi:hypothetical protein